MEIIKNSAHMTITKDDVEKVAKLAHITLSSEEVRAYQGELNSILGMLGSLHEVDASDVEPLGSPISSSLPMRQDVSETLNILPEMLANAPDAKYGCFVVPKVVE